MALWSIVFQLPGMASLGLMSPIKPSCSPVVQSYFQGVSRQAGLLPLMAKQQRTLKITLDTRQRHLKA